MNSDVTTWALPKGAIARLGRGTVRDMAFSPDGQYLAVGTAIGLWLYESQTLSPIALWDTGRGMTENVRFSPDGRWIITKTFTEDVKIWDTNSGACIAIMEKQERLPSISQPIFSPDGQRVLAATNENAWNKKPRVAPGKSVCLVCTDRQTDRRNRNAPNPKSRVAHRILPKSHAIGIHSLRQRASCGYIGCRMEFGDR